MLLNSTLGKKDDASYPNVVHNEFLTAVQLKHIQMICTEIMSQN